MATIVNITSWNVTSDGEDLNVTNTGWTKNTTAGAYGSGAIKIASASPNTAWVSAVDSAGYLRNETPGSANQNVRITLKRVGALITNQRTYVVARATSGGDDWAGLYVSYDGGSPTIRPMQCVNNSISSLAGEGNVSGLASVGDTATLEIRVSGSAPTISLAAYWNGSLYYTWTITSSVLDPVGKVGWMGTTTAATATTGMHVTTFFAEDDSSGATGGGPLIGGLVRPILTRGRLVA